MFSTNAFKKLILILFLFLILKKALIGKRREELLGKRREEKNRIVI